DRFMWDMHYTPFNVPPTYPISATYMNTAPQATSAWVMPGMYTAKLTVNGKINTQIFEVKMDPRVKTTVQDLQQQHDLSLMCYNNIKQCKKKLEGLNENTEVAKTLTGFINKFTTIHGALQESDMVLTTQMIKATQETTAAFTQFYRSLK
ncbi:MAG: glycoside hydrolase, partial [Ferruginibacter sp.]|nr:glycoside hydrolase [Ferruginibacter sp.]